MRLTLTSLPILLALAACGDKPDSTAAQPSGSESPASPTAAAEPVEGAPAAAQSEPVSFDRTLDYNGISFRVQTTGEGSIRNLTITPAGLETDNSPIYEEIDGSVSGAEVDDLNADGSPEIYVYTTSAGSGSYGALIAYAANNRKSLSKVYLPPLEDNAEASKGYMGHDEFAVFEGTLVHRFPLYAEGDTNAAPSGGYRQLQYKLEAGEAGWVMRLDKVVDF